MSGQACSSETDYFAVDLEEGQTLVVALRAWFREGDIDLFLYDPAGYPVVMAREEKDGEWLVHEASTTGRYALRVLPLVSGNVYGLELRVLDVLPACDGDSHEPNDTRVEATTVAVPVGDVTLVRGLLCPVDEDWYAVELDERNVLTADIALDSGDLAELEVRCTGPDGVTRGGMVPSDGGGRVFCAARQAGLHTLRILHAAELVGAPMDYRVELRREARCTTGETSIEREAGVQIAHRRFCPFDLDNL